MRRQFSADFKRRVVAETHAAGTSVSVVARRHDINANLLFRWRDDPRYAFQEQSLGYGSRVMFALLSKAGVTGLTELEDKHASLEARHKAESQNRDMMITKLRHQLFGLRKDKFGSSGEGLDQLGLRLEDEESGQELNIATTESDVAEETAPNIKSVRRPLPERLPRTDVKLTSDKTCAGCGSELDDLEDWLSKQLTHISGKSPLAGAIRYALTRIPQVRPYLEHGFWSWITTPQSAPCLPLS